MNNIPPVYRSSAVVSDQNTFARQAANASVAAPLFIILLNIACRSLLEAHQGGNARSLILVQGGLSFLLMVTGLILGVLAIGFMKSGGRAGIVVRATVGILLSGSLLAIFVPNFVRARTTALSQHQSVAEVRAAAKNFKTEAISALNEGRAPDASRLIQSLDSATQTATGETTAILKGTSGFMQSLKLVQSNYTQASQELTTADVLRGKDLTDREQLQRRKAVVQRFLDANAVLKQALESGEENYRAELTKQNVSTAGIAAAMEGFHKSNATQRPMISAIREADDRIGGAMLGALDLLETNWGQWRYDAATNRKLFNSPEILQKYNACIQEIDAARKNETAAQKQLAGLMSEQMAER